jgi:hypothetical protein
VANENISEAFNDEGLFLSTHESAIKSYKSFGEGPSIKSRIFQKSVLIFNKLSLNHK